VSLFAAKDDVAVAGGGARFAGLWQSRLAAHSLAWVPLVDSKERLIGLSTRPCVSCPHRGQDSLA